MPDTQEAENRQKAARGLSDSVRKAKPIVAPPWPSEGDAAEPAPGLEQRGETYEISPSKIAHPADLRGPWDPRVCLTSDVRSIGGVEVQAASRSEVISRYLLSIQNRQKLYLAFANTNLVNCANRSSAVMTALQRFDIVNDGVGMQIVSLILHGRKFPENLNGTDLVPFLLANSPAPTRVFLFGATPRSVKAAAAALSAYPHVVICGSRDGYSCWSNIQTLVREINNAEPDVILVALGNPVQELWIARYGSELEAPVIIAVGALFDFLSGSHNRAPLLVRRARLEWLHRLACEPERLWRRYSLDIAYFLFVVLLSGRSQMRNLELLLGRLTLEVEILRDTLDRSRAREPILSSAADRRVFDRE